MRELSKKDLRGSKQLHVLLPKLRLVGKRRREELLPPELNGRESVRKLEPLLNSEPRRLLRNAREESLSIKPNKRDLDKKPSLKLRPIELNVKEEWLNSLPRLKLDVLRMKRELNKLDLNGRPELKLTGLRNKELPLNLQLKQRPVELRRREESLKPEQH